MQQIKNHDQYSLKSDVILKFSYNYIPVMRLLYLRLFTPTNDYDTDYKNMVNNVHDSVLWYKQTDNYQTLDLTFDKVFFHKAYQY